MRRYIYIHGCPDSAELGKPGSIGCVRMRNRDIAELVRKGGALHAGRDQRLKLLAVGRQHHAALGNDSR
jgi:hypothetical protein